MAVPPNEPHVLCLEPTLQPRLAGDWSVQDTIVLRLPTAFDWSNTGPSILLVVFPASDACGLAVCIVSVS